MQPDTWLFARTGFAPTAAPFQEIVECERRDQNSRVGDTNADIAQGAAWEQDLRVMSSAKFRAALSFGRPRRNAQSVWSSKPNLQQIGGGEVGSHSFC